MTATPRGSMKTSSNPAYTDYSSFSSGYDVPLTTDALTKAVPQALVPSPRPPAPTTSPASRQTPRCYDRAHKSESSDAVLHAEKVLGRLALCNPEIVDICAKLVDLV